MRLAVIPARGGSKRIPRKNIKLFYGKPMIAWSIKAAIASKCFDRIIVSTDDKEIAEIAKAYGAEVPFFRPTNLSDDFTGTTEVIAHAILWALEKGWPLSLVCCIYPTAPLIQPKDLKNGLELIETGPWLYSFSATDFAAPIFRSFKRHVEGGVEMFFKEHFSTRSQELPIALHDAGQFYWGQPNAWVEGKQIFDLCSTPVIVPRWRVQDIDTEDDWARAEIIASIIETIEIKNLKDKDVI